MEIVDTMTEMHMQQRPVRRQYSAQFKAEVVGQCRRSGASVAGVALSHGINANVVHRWLREHTSAAPGLPTPHEFVPVTLDAPAGGAAGGPEPDIRIELRRGNSAVVVTWPLKGAASCAAWLRDWLN